MNDKEMDLGAFISHLAAATAEENYDWRLSCHSERYTLIDEVRQFSLLGTLDRRQDYSVVEVVARRAYRVKNMEYPADKVMFAMTGDNIQGDLVFHDIGLSMAIMHVSEITSLTFYRGRPL